MRTPYTDNLEHEQREKWLRSYKWDQRFMDLARLVATWSKDPSSKIGAVIVRPDLSVASIGYNGFPRGMRDDAELYEDREIKYSRIVHAEVNAILNAHGSVAGFTLYTSGLPPCDRCAVTLIQAGIQHLVHPPVPEPALERWRVSIDAAKQMLREAGVRLTEI